ncbi:MAG: hypothetical protein K6C97_03275 [Treponema sp.]|nr:hypothetical protein [Treponema sp.]
MIWLKKIRNGRIYEGKFDITIFLQQMMEPFEDYIRSIKEQEISMDVIRDAQFHLYQLMEIYVDCKICSIWTGLDDKGKSKFFNTFSKEKKLSSYVDFGFNYFSKAEYQLYPESLKQNLATLFTEYLQDFTKAFSLCVKKTKPFHDLEPGFNKVDALDSQLSFYLFQGMWTAIRLYPSGPCKYETIVQNGAIKPNYDFLNGQLYNFNADLELSPVINTVEFYQNCAEEAILDFIQLGGYIYGDAAKVQSNISILNKKLDEVRQETKQNREALFSLVDSFEAFKNQVSKNDEVMTLDEMMEDLKSDQNYITIVKSVPEFEQYCLFLLQNEWQFYKNRHLCKSEKWHKYFYANFLNDRYLHLLEAKKTIEPAYRKLFGLSESEKLKAQYGDTYAGYDNFISIPLRKWMKK